MSMDKMIGTLAISCNNGTDTNFVQSNTVILDNSAGVIPKTIRTLFVNSQVYAETSNKMYYAILLVTAQDAAIPNFQGNEAALNVALNSYRDLIWATQAGIVKSGSGIPDDALIPFEPKTGRKLEPGQKLVFILLGRNYNNTTAGLLLGEVDWNIWFDY